MPFDSFCIGIPPKRNNSYIFSIPEMPPWRHYVERAKYAALGITVTVAFTSGALYVFTNATYYGLRKFKRNRILRATNRSPAEISDATETLVWKTMDDASVSGYQRGNMMFFPSRNSGSSLNPAEPTWRGSLYMRSGAAIGLPFYYNWERPEHVNLQILEKAWGIKLTALSESDVKILQNCCVLSENAKKFGIARCLSMMYNNEVLYGILHFEFFLFTSLMTATFMWNARMPAWLNALGFIGNFALWRLVTFWYRQRVYRQAVKSAVTVSENTAEGAKEFYEKTIKLNKLIQKATGSALSNPFALFWSCIFSIRPSGMSLEKERFHASKVKELIESGDLVFKPLCRGYVAAGKRMAMPPVPILPTSEAVSEPEKYLKRTALEGDLEKEILNTHFRHLQK